MARGVPTVRRFPRARASGVAASAATTPLTDAEPGGDERHESTTAGEGPPPHATVLGLPAGHPLEEAATGTLAALLAAFATLAILDLVDGAVVATCCAHLEHLRESIQNTSDMAPPQW